MKAYRKIGTLLLIIFIVIQFIQPTKNTANGLGDNDISRVYVLPSDVHDMFVKKCYDCHSNNTRYPWYFNVQPIGWWLAAHVHDGKEHLNFSEFQNYSLQRRVHKLEEVGEVVVDRSMPLKTYTMLHEHTELTAEDEQAVKNWLHTLTRPRP
jgi:hypothetical protein